MKNAVVVLLLCLLAGLPGCRRNEYHRSEDELAKIRKTRLSLAEDDQAQLRRFYGEPDHIVPYFHHKLWWVYVSKKRNYVLFEFDRLNILRNQKNGMDFEVPTITERYIEKPFIQPREIEALEQRFRVPPLDKRQSRVRFYGFPALPNEFLIEVNLADSTAFFCRAAVSGAGADSAAAAYQVTYRKTPRQVDVKQFIRFVQGCDILNMQSYKYKECGPMDNLIVYVEAAMDGQLNEFQFDYGYYYQDKRYNYFTDFVAAVTKVMDYVWISF